VSGGNEVAVSFDHAGFASGGGFSNYASMPAYQQNAVGQYFQSGVLMPPSSNFNNSNRGYPDVSAAGADYLIYMGGFTIVGGTSASSPAFASVAAFLNYNALKKSGTPLGFLNPFLYQLAEQHPETFTDITVGDNYCTEEGCGSSCTGFLCAKGWDPVTGLGTPVVSAMLQFV